MLSIYRILLRFAARSTLRSPSVIEISSDSEVDAELNSDVFGIQSLTRMPPPKDFKLNSDLFGIQTRRRTPQRDFKHLFASLSPDADVEIGNSPTPKAHRKPPTQFGCNASPINIKNQTGGGGRSLRMQVQKTLSPTTRVSSQRFILSRSDSPKFSLHSRARLSLLNALLNAQTGLHAPS